MGNPMSQTIDPLRVAADIILKRLQAAAKESRSETFDANALIVWIGNELSQSVEEHDRLIHETRLLTYTPDPNEDEEYEDDDADYSITESGHILDEREIRAYDRETPVPTHPTGDIIQKIFGKNATIDDLPDVTSGSYDEDIDTPGFRLETIADMLEIDVAKIAGFDEDESDYDFQLDSWLISKGRTAEKLEASVRSHLRNRLIAVAKLKPKK